MFFIASHDILVWCLPCNFVFNLLLSLTLLFAIFFVTSPGNSGLFSSLVLIFPDDCSGREIPEGTLVIHAVMLVPSY